MQTENVEGGWTALRSGKERKEAPPLVVPALFAGLAAACARLSNDDGECCVRSFARHVLRRPVRREAQGMGIRGAAARGVPPARERERGAARAADPASA